MNTMEYKGYTASVEYDDEAGILYGRVLYLRDGIDFQADNVAGLKKEFQASVDDYLTWCAELGDEPEKPFSGKFVVRIDPSLHRDAAIAAARDGLSLNEWVKRSVEASLKPTPKATLATSLGKRQEEREQHVDKVADAMLEAFVAKIEASLSNAPRHTTTLLQPERFVLQTEVGNVLLKTRRQRETSLN